MFELEGIFLKSNPLLFDIYEAVPLSNNSNF